ncbi:hypothetical protein ACHAWF_013807 [Thalassiosira exigua]
MSRKRGLSTRLKPRRMSMFVVLYLDVKSLGPLVGRLQLNISIWTPLISPNHIVSPRIPGSKALVNGDRGNLPSSSICADDVVAENVFVFVECNHYSTTTAAPADCAANFEAVEVDIRPRESTSFDWGEVSDDPSRLTQRATCFALGKILFELFSRGDPFLLIELDMVGGIDSGEGRGSDPFSKFLLGDMDLNSDSSIGGIDGQFGKGQNTHIDTSISSSEDDRCNAPIMRSAKASKRSSLSTVTSSAVGFAEPHQLTKSMKARAFLEGQGLPMSVCQLVSDLLDAEEGNPYEPNTALLTLEEARCDLFRMKQRPDRFLHDFLNPRAAWEGTALFGPNEGELYGREREMEILMERKAQIFAHVSHPTNFVNFVGPGGGIGAANCHRAQSGPVSMLEPGGGDTFPCEAVFLAGHSGSGKSTLVRRLISNVRSECSERRETCLVITCKFDRGAAPLSALLRSFDEFLKGFVPVKDLLTGLEAPRDRATQDVCDHFCRSLVSSVDGESFCQLCELLPSLCELFPASKNYVDGKRRARRRSSFEGGGDHVADMLTSGAVGAASNRLRHLFQILFRAVLVDGSPTTLVLDDIQWSDAFTRDVVGDLVEVASGSGAPLPQRQAGVNERGPPSPADRQRALLLVGTYRDNEVDEGFLAEWARCMEQSSRNVRVTTVHVGELREGEVNALLSSKFCLPPRHTKELAQLVHQKSRGHPLYVIEFLRSIIQRNLLHYSVKSRRWMWDAVAVDLEMITDGVVDLLMRKLRCLPHDVVEALKIMSCMGQLKDSILELLDLSQFVPDLVKALSRAAAEGIVERAGPLYAFAHDALQESTYCLILPDERNALRRRIGKSLAQDPEVASNPELCALAVDQINACDDPSGALDSVERSLFAQLNLAAGQHAIDQSSYEQARGYFDGGISLLVADPWAKQYDLCLKLHEMSAVVAFMYGKIEAVSSRLDAVLSKARTPDDALNARVLRARFLASQEKHNDATNELLALLSRMGEDFPRDNWCQGHVTSVIEATLLSLRHVRKETILDLPAMTNVRKCHAMKLMGLLITIGTFISPMLTPLLCCRMVKLTFEYGFCEDTISGLAAVSHALMHYSNDVQLASRIARIAESLISGHFNEHSLRARFTFMTATVKVFVEPWQMTVEHCLNGYLSSKIVGDVDNAMLCGLIYCIAYVHAIPDLTHLHNFIVNILPHMAKHKRLSVLRSTMSIFDAVISLTGNGDRSSFNMDAGIEITTNDELYAIAQSTQNSYLLHHVVVNKMMIHFYFREYLCVLDLAEKYEIYTGRKAGTKRNLDIVVCFFEGIAALCLARESDQDKWKIKGQESISRMSAYLERAGEATTTTTTGRPPRRRISEIPNFSTT